MPEGRRSRVPTTPEDAQAYAHKFGLPVEVEGAFVLNGWKKVAKTLEELREFVTEGQRLSPVGEVTLYWNVTQ